MADDVSRSNLELRFWGIQAQVVRALEYGGFRVIPILWLLFLGLALTGCGYGGKSVSGSREATAPLDLPAVANDRYEQVQVTIDGKPVDAGTTITVGRDFVVTVSFRRLHVWPGLDNLESMIEAVVIEQYREHTLTRRYPTLKWQSKKRRADLH